jgi:glycosyltransferase involved in cell wall biosynthesis
VAGDAAILVDPADTQAIAAALGRFANEPELRQALRERGFRQAAAFSWDRCGDETMAILTSLASTR